MHGVCLQCLGHIGDDDELDSAITSGGSGNSLKRADLHLRGVYTLAKLCDGKRRQASQLVKRCDSRAIDVHDRVVPTRQTEDKL